MDLKISPNKALKRLEKRLIEIDSHNFDPYSWKEITKNELQEIFGVSDSKHLQISALRFTTPLPSEKLSALNKGKEQAKQFLNSYIDLIKEYSAIEQENYSESEKLLKRKILDLKGEITHLNSEKKALFNTQEKLKEADIKKSSLIAKLEKNTVQLTNLTLKKIFDLIQNLPMKHVIYLIGIISSLVVSCFLLGQKWERIVKSNEKVELKQNNNYLISENEMLSDSISYLKTEIKRKEKSNTTAHKAQLRNKVSIVMFNTLDKGISIKFENVSKNHNKISSHGTSIHPNEFAKLDLNIANYKWIARKFIDYKKSAKTENSNYKESIIRIDSTDRIKFIKID